LQPTQQQTRYRKSPCAPSEGGEGKYLHFIISIPKQVTDLLIHPVGSVIVTDGGAAQAEGGSGN